MDDAKKDPVIRVATNEYTLLLYRAITSGCALLMTWWVFDLKVETKDLRKEFTSYQLQEEARLSRLEGQVVQLNSSVEVHRQRLENNSVDIRQIWTRIFELGRNAPFTAPAPRTPVP